MLGCTCQVARGFHTFAPCLEHVCAGGGGSVANVGLWFMLYIILLVYVSSSRRVVMVTRGST